MAISRSNPDVGYIGNDVFEAFAFNQNVRAGNTLYISGIAPLQGGLPDLHVVAEDQRGQAEFCLEVLRRSLAAEGASPSNLVAWTLYTTDMAGLAQLGDLFVDFCGKNGPSATAVQVVGLFHPQQMIEITATAVLG